MNPTQIIRDTLGHYLKQPTPAYPRSLPADLAPWHCYTIDGGHGILALLASQVEPWPTNPLDMLVPVPVKSILRGYKTHNGYIVSTSPDVGYDSNLGLLTPSEDDEY